MMQGESQTIDGGEEIASPHAFVGTVTTRLAINELNSARARREQYVGQWLPEPIISGGNDHDPVMHAEIADSLSLAMLVLLELSPEQRAALVLHDVSRLLARQHQSPIVPSDCRTQLVCAPTEGHLGKEYR